MEENIFKGFMEGYVNIHNELVDLDVSDKSKKIEQLDKVIMANDTLVQDYIKQKELQRMANGNMKKIDLNSKEEHKEFEEQTKQYMENIKNAEKEKEEIKKKHEENLNRKKQLENAQKSIRERAKALKEEQVAEEENKKENSELIKRYEACDKQEIELKRQLEKFKGIELETTKQEVERIGIENELRDVNEKKKSIAQQINQQTDRAKKVEKDYVLFLGQLSIIDKTDEKIIVQKDNTKDEKQAQKKTDSQKAGKKTETKKGFYPPAVVEEPEPKMMTSQELFDGYKRAESEWKDASRRYKEAQNNGASNEELAKLANEVREKEKEGKELLDKYKMLEEMTKGKENRENERYDETIKEAMKQEKIKKEQEEIDLQDNIKEGEEKGIEANISKIEEKKRWVTSITISEKTGKISWINAQKDEDSIGIEETFETQKEKFKRLQIPKKCKEIAGGPFRAFLLRKKINPEIVVALESNPTQLEEYISAIYNKKQLPFELTHDLRGADIFTEHKRNRYTKAEKKSGAKVLIEKFNKNEALGEGKDASETKQKTETVRDRVKEDNEDNHIEKGAMEQAEKKLRDTQEQIANDVQKIMNEEGRGIE